MQASLHKAFRHGRTISGCRGSLGYHTLEASPKQPMVTKEDSVGILCQHISLVALGIGSQPEGLRPLWTALAPTSTVAMLAYLTPALAREAVGMRSQADLRVWVVLRRCLWILFAA